MQLPATRATGSGLSKKGEGKWAKTKFREGMGRSEGSARGRRVRGNGAYTKKIYIIIIMRTQENGGRILNKLSTHTFPTFITSLLHLLNPAWTRGCVNTINTSGRATRSVVPQRSTYHGGHRHSLRLMLDPPRPSQTSLTLYETLNLCGRDTLQLMTQLTNIIKASYYTHDKSNMRERRHRLCA